MNIHYIQYTKTFIKFIYQVWLFLIHLQFNYVFLFANRIIVTDSEVTDLSGDAGVYRLDIEYGLTVDETVAVSDHYPVYVELWCGRDVY